MARTALLALALFFAAQVAPAAPTDPVVVELPPVGQGEAFVTGIRTLDDLQHEYVEEEYFVSGTSRIYNYAHDPPLSPGDVFALPFAIPYKTRIIVRRPVAPGVFNGTVVVEWWNSTAGFDSAPVWDTSAEYFGRNGFAYVGVTNSTTALDFLKAGCSIIPGLLPPTCGTRYASLAMGQNAIAYEMVSQIANLLKSDSPDNPLPPDFEVERLYHAGQSQQGGSIVTYASAFHFPVNDGYFVQTAVNARALNDLAVCGSPSANPFPACRPLLAGADALVRTDLPVPVVQALTETDVAILWGTAGRQADTPTYRYYEMAGTAHLTVHEDVEVLPAGVFGPDPLFLHDFCELPMNSTADGPVLGGFLYNAMWENLERQVRKGRKPPHAEPIEVVDGVIQRDAYGNALGGIRLPQLDVPIESYGPSNNADPGLPPPLQAIGNLVCFLAGTVMPLDPATLDALYPSHGAYVSQIQHRANALRKARFLLPKDAAKLRVAAATSPIGCGLGFELALVLPPLLWLYRRRRRPVFAFSSRKLAPSP